MNLPDIDPESLTGNKVVRTFRMPQQLVNILGKEANGRGLDLTALVLRILHGYLTYFALPEAAIAQLEADREALKMDRNQYLSHLLYHRCLAICENGTGFDDPHIQQPKKADAGNATTEPTQPQEDRPPHPMGVIGGGAHSAVKGLVPGAGLWPYGIKENQRRKG